MTSGYSQQTLDQVSAELLVLLPAKDLNLPSLCRGYEGEQQVGRGVEDDLSRILADQQGKCYGQCDAGHHVVSIESPGRLSVDRTEGREPFA